MWTGRARVSADENVEFTLSFLSNEVQKAISDMKANSAPGNDELPMVFFQKFCDKIQTVLMPIFQEFYIATLVMSLLNVLSPRFLRL
jgi:hypothetical protein